MIVEKLISHIQIIKIRNQNIQMISDVIMLGIHIDLKINFGFYTNLHRAN